MHTPIHDFVQGYAASGVSRLHMPGHKGKGPMGCEALDITEIRGADSLYEAEGVIAESERNAARLFGAGRTFYSAGGSSQCLKAMVHLAVQLTGRRRILAARNAHKAFLQAAALLDLEVDWLWPEGAYQLLCCPVTAAGLERALAALPEPPAAVFLTSPDYLGHLQPVGELAAVCHRRGVLLLVDNAHGAYLHFLERPIHPMDLGADLCCDSAHKTLPVLTGGAYLHLRNGFPVPDEAVRQAMALFGSTSPSYLILQSLDLCNAFLAEEERQAVGETAKRAAALKETLRARGFRLAGEEPLKVTICGPGRALAERLRRGGAECEYADGDHLVLMFSPGSGAEDYARVLDALGAPPAAEAGRAVPPMAPPRRAMSIRQALLAPEKRIPAAKAAGRICAAPTVSCPPAVPVVVSGEVIGADAAEVLAHYGVGWVSVVDGAERS